MQQRLGGIEACRGIAASAVVLYHVSRHLDFVYGAPVLKRIFQFGHAGVDLFFVISGFIILFVHYDDINHPQRSGHYIARRATRIFPVYWVALTTTILLSFLGGRELPSGVRVMWSVTLLPSHEQPLLGVAWTLQYEIVFYAAFLLLILNRMMGLTALAFWLWWIGLESAVDGGPLPGSLYSPYNVEFFFGMLVAYWLRNKSMPFPRSVLGIGILLFAVAALMEDLGFFDGYAGTGRFIYGLPAALVILGVAESDRQGLLDVPTLLRELGRASYSIYLFQFIFIGIVWKIAERTGVSFPHIAVFLALVGAAIAGGIVVSRLIEYPLMRFARHVVSMNQPSRISDLPHRRRRSLMRPRLMLGGPTTWKHRLLHRLLSPNRNER